MSRTIEVGAKLRKKDAPDYKAEIVELLISDHELPHARVRIKNGKYDLGVRLYAISALEDTRLFLPAMAHS